MNVKATGLKEIWKFLQNHVGNKNKCDCYTDKILPVYNWKVVSLVLPEITDWDTTIKLYHDGARYNIEYPHTDMCICPVQVVYSYIRVANSCAMGEILAGHIIDLEKIVNQRS